MALESPKTTAKLELTCQASHRHIWVLAAAFYWMRERGKGALGHLKKAKLCTAVLKTPGELAYECMRTFNLCQGKA